MNVFYWLQLIDQNASSLSLLLSHIITIFNSLSNSLLESSFYYFYVALSLSLDNFIKLFCAALCSLNDTFVSVPFFLVTIMLSFADNFQQSDFSTERSFFILSSFCVLHEITIICNVRTEREVFTTSSWCLILFRGCQGKNQTKDARCWNK